MGRRRISIERLESPTKREVTFSKRRKGLFKKASDLCMLSNAQIAIITFSPHGNPFVFGHSSVDSVIGHYLNGTVPAGDGITSEHTRIVSEIKDREALLKEEKKSKDDRKSKEKIGVDCDEWFKIEEINYRSLEELQFLHDELMEVREKVTKRIGIMSMANSISGCFSNGVNNVCGDLLTLPAASSSTVYVGDSLLHSHGARSFNEVYQSHSSKDHGKDGAVVDDAIREEVASGWREEDSSDYSDVFDWLQPLF